MTRPTRLVTFSWLIASSLASLSCTKSTKSGDSEPGGSSDIPDASSPPDASPTQDAQQTTSTTGGIDAGSDEEPQLIIDMVPEEEACVTGHPCENGGVCAAGMCCAANAACGDVCCADGELCSFNQCVVLGSSCTDRTDCAEDEYCEYAVGDEPVPVMTSMECVGGAAPLEGRCLPRPPVCAASEDAADGLCLELCEYHSPAEEFDIQLEYSWVAPEGESSNIMMTPIVVQLDDDNCDGKVTEQDIPDILFTSIPGNYNGTGVLRAISILQGTVQEKWQVSTGVHATKQIAGGDLDGTSGAEVVTCGTEGDVHAYHSDGELYWTSPEAVECFMPSIADMDGDGHPEVVVEGGILNGQTGEVLHPLSVVGPIVLSDIDGDGVLDVVTAGEAFGADGSLLVDTQLIEPASYRDTGDWKGPWAAVADFDADGKPEIVAIDNMNHMLTVWRYDASSATHFEVVREPVDINGMLDVSHCPSGWGSHSGGGPPTIGDFNADGVPDVAVAGGVGYAVFDGTRLMADPPEDPVLWASQTQDCSSASTGSSLFDFNGDGRAEVIYSDEEYLRVYNGDDGEVLTQQCNSTGTLSENPIVADVNGDGQANIVVVSNDLSQCEGESQSGLRVFGSASGSWVRTRGVWNQHAYHITNIEDDGTSIPAQEPANWLQSGLNNFRQNKQPGKEFAAPDAVVSLQPICGEPEEAVAVVRNIGEAALPAGVQVKLAAVTDTDTVPLAEGVTTHMLHPAQAEQVTLSIAESSASAVNAAQAFSVELEVDPDWHECRTDNNSGSIPHEPCSVSK